MTHTKNSTPNQRFLKITAFIVVAFGVGVGVFVLVYGFYKFALQEIPVPEMVSRFSEERSTSGTETTQALAARTTRGSDVVFQTTSHPQAERSDLPNQVDVDRASTVTEPLFPDDPSLPEELRELRGKVNETYAECIAILDECRRNAEVMPFGEARRKLWRVRNLQQGLLPGAPSYFRLLRMSWELNRDSRGRTKDSEREREIWAKNDLYNGILRQRRALLYEFAVRHKRWYWAAQSSSSWNEEVYFYRQIGGLRGYGHLVARNVERSWKFLHDKLR